MEGPHELERVSVDQTNGLRKGSGEGSAEDSIIRNNANYRYFSRSNQFVVSISLNLVNRHFNQG